MLRRIALLILVVMAVQGCSGSKPVPTDPPPTAQQPADYLDSARRGLQSARDLFDTVVQWQATAKRDPSKLDSIREPLLREAQKCANSLYGALPEVAPPEYSDFNERALAIVSRVMKSCNQAAEAIEDQDDSAFRSLNLAAIASDLDALRSELE